MKVQTQNNNHCFSSIILKKLLKHNLQSIRKGDDNGYTLFIASCEYGYYELVEFLVEMGVDINEATKNGETALMIAARNEYYNIVEYLISKGADITISNNDFSCS